MKKRHTGHDESKWDEVSATPERVVNLLRQIEVGIVNGKTTSQACTDAEIVEQTYFRWRKEYGGLKNCVL